MAIPVLVLLFQGFLEIEPPIFLFALFICPILIIGLLNFMNSEENGLSPMCVEFLNPL